MEMTRTVGVVSVFAKVCKHCCHPSFYAKPNDFVDAPLPTIAGSHMSLLRPAPPRARKSDGRKTGDVS